MIISRADMTAHIEAGRARPWTRALGSENMVPAVAQLNGEWFVVVAGTDGYQRAPEPLAWLLTAAQLVLGAGDEETSAGNVT